MNKVIGLLCSLVLLIGCILPIKPAFAKENNDGNNKKMVQVVLYSDKDQVIMSEVPKNYEKEYLAKLEDSTFKNAEIQKSLGVNTSSETANPNVAYAAATSPAFVDYMTRSDVIRIVDAMDNSINWSLYLSNPLTDSLLATAVTAIMKKTTYGVIATALAWSSSYVMSKQVAWWKDSEIMILKGQITGVKLSVTPGPPSGYPAAYITLTRY